MSNNNRPTFSLGAKPPAPLPPPPGAQADVADLLARYPLPWCVGPFGDIWVSADVEIVDPDVVGPRGVVDGKWRATGSVARKVIENPADKGIAALIVAAVNNAHGKR